MSEQTLAGGRHGDDFSQARAGFRSFVRKIQRGNDARRTLRQIRDLSGTGDGDKISFTGVGLSYTVNDITGGRNYFEGGPGDDVMLGNAGDDSFGGELGNDRFNGGKGGDLFFNFAGRDVITGFRGTGPEDQHDRLLVSGSYSLKRAGDDVIVDFIDSTYSIRLLGCKVAQVEDDIVRL